MKFSDYKFFDFLSNEEQNLRSNIDKLKSSLNIFLRLDNLFKSPLDSEVVNEIDIVIPGLYLMVHSKFYFSMSCILRGHLSDGFGSTRSAIDASLTAYKIILEPDSKESYVKRERLFQNIKSNLSKEREKDNSKYPLAVALIELHDMCSEHVSHADVSALKHRVDILDQDKSGKPQLVLKYFDSPNNEILFHAVIVDFLVAFHAMLVIFQPYIAEKFSIKSEEWGAEIQRIREELKNEQRKLQEKLKGSV